MKRAGATLLFALCAAMPAQSQQTDPRPTFEVAELKPADPNSLMKGKGRILPGGRLEIAGMSTKDMIMFSYGVQENIIVGLPGWASNERYDLVAKAPVNTPPPTLRLMLQSLLAERFQLSFHKEDKVLPVYVLSVGKKGSKLEKGTDGPQTCLWQSGDQGLRRRKCQNITMAELAMELPGWAGLGIDLPVVDQTGLDGRWSFQFEVGLPQRGRGEGGGIEGQPQATVADSGPTIFDALERLGLKLESRKLPTSVIAVDRIEKPSDQ